MVCIVDREVGGNDFLCCMASISCKYTYLSSSPSQIVIDFVLRMVIGHDSAHHTLSLGCRGAGHLCSAPHS